MPQALGPHLRSPPLEICQLEMFMLSVVCDAGHILMIVEIFLAVKNLFVEVGTNQLMAPVSNLIFSEVHRLSCRSEQLIRKE